MARERDKSTPSLVVHPAGTPDHELGRAGIRVLDKEHSRFVLSYPDTADRLAPMDGWVSGLLGSSAAFVPHVHDACFAVTRTSTLHVEQVVAAGGSPSFVWPSSHGTVARISVWFAGPESGRRAHGEVGHYDHDPMILFGSR